MKKLAFLCCFLVLLVACSKEDEKSTSNISSTKFGSPLKFKTFDLKGNPVDESIFKYADVTLVNIWATWCGPCKRELPELGELAKAYEPEGYQVIGLIHDVTDDFDMAEEALEILADAGCDYQVLVNTESMTPIFNDVVAYPTTFFVDKNGKILGSEHAGAMTKAQFESEFQKAIQLANSAN